MPKDSFQGFLGLVATHNLHPCCRVMQQNQEYLPKVLAVFLGDCGMGHPDEACTALTFITALQRHHEITFCSITTLSLTVYVLHGSDWSSLSESVIMVGLLMLSMSCIVFVLMMLAKEERGKEIRKGTCRAPNRSASSVLHLFAAGITV